MCLRYHPAHPHRANNPRGGGSHPDPSRSRHAIATRSSVRACGSRPNPTRSRHAIATRSLVSRQGSKVHHRSQHPWPLPHARGAEPFCVSVVRRTFPHPDPTCSRHTIATFASRKRFRKRESRYRARQHDVDSGRHAERLKQIHTLGRKNPPLDCSTITTAYNDTPERAEIVDVTANDTAE